MATLFVFAHQDDDYGIFPVIESACNLGEAYCIYLTDGGALALRRNDEALNVLSRLGARPQNIFFLGSAHNFGDGHLLDHLRAVVDSLIDFLATHENITDVYVPAWEGGHIDHDTANAATMLAIKRSGRKMACWQFSLYNSYQCKQPFYNVMRPIPGAADYTHRVPLSRRLRYALLPLLYPSQWKIWIGLYPFIMYNYIIKGELLLQEASLERIFSRPHDGKLFYERKNGNRYEHLQRAIRSIQDG